MKSLSPFKNDVKITLFLLMVPLVAFLFAPGFFISPHTLAAEHNHSHQNSISEKSSSDASNSQGETKTPSSKTWAYSLLGIYCSLIVFSSLLGGWLPSLIRLTHTRMETLISFVGGLMLGIGVFHLLPHAISEMGSIDRAVWWMMAGILTLFFLLRTFHFHQHGTVELDDENKHEHDHDCDLHHAHAHSHSHTQTHKLSWVGIAFGLALHTLIDGLALGASIIAEQNHEVFLSLFGLGTFLAITLHKPLDAVSITSLMAAGGWSAGWRNAVNIGFALMCPLGALLFFLGVQQFSENQHVIIGCALAFSAGVFICISLGDLLPEMEFHSHNRFRLSFVLLLGIALAYGIGFIEPDHVHHHGNQGHSDTDKKSEDSHDHKHHDHKH